jgi:hypothetical protein
MTVDEYYTAPSEVIFDEIKKASISIWEGYDDSYGYASGKINSIKNLENVGDNAWRMVAMFDVPNQRKLITRLSREASRMVLNALNS